ncbi:MAG: hypothetical protein R3346_02015 [Candidatus Spechtbacterales bacterium]|nr:hypothetical protein [Candidatus Spechtbacterales bacterium]
MFKAIGIIMLLVALRILFGGVVTSAETFLQEFFNFGTAVMHDSAAQLNLSEYPAKE